MDQSDIKSNKKNVIQHISNDIYTKYIYKFQLFLFIQKNAHVKKIHLFCANKRAWFFQMVLKKCKCKREYGNVFF